ncbi:recombinase family protein [Pseudomonas sp. BN515]|uniref:recombinase family protein n=1 Tax=Pseudomonas sp. BN515 TaxID=2567892 RepID=UPI0024542A82|nr:recombinase family protein [Pseudomonas sp. BN515]MDH4872907.1 recombinase family protein [Pseudomonas sp. BN515]
MPYAVPYLRFSHVSQRAGSTVERQEEMIGKWLAANPDYTLFTQTFKDLGRSGFKGAHLKHNFGKLLQAVRDGAIKPGDVILIEAIDRAGRLEPLEMFPLFSEIVLAGVTIITLDDGARYDRESVNNHNLFQLIGKIQQAYNYSATLSRRVRESYVSRQKKAKDGEKVKIRTPIWLDKDGKLIDDLAPLIRQSFEDFATGIGEKRIHARIADKHPLLAKLDPTTIRRWMGLKVAIGYWGDIPDAFPPVIDRELFYRVQQRLKPNANAPTPAAARKYLLAGLVRCGVCGANATVKANKGKGTFFVCGRRHRIGQLGCTNNTSVPYLLFDQIRKWTSVPYVQAALKRQQLSESQKQAIVVRGELDDINQRLANLYELAELRMTDQLKRRIQVLVEAQDEKQGRLNFLESDSSHIEPVFAHDVGVSLEFLDGMRLNAMLKSVDYAIGFFPDGSITAPSPSGEDVISYAYAGYAPKPAMYLLDTPDGRREFPNPSSKKHQPKPKLDAAEPPES